MDDMKSCKVSACCKGNVCGIVGMVLVILATILTLYTLSSLGIFAMFIVGLMLGCHKHFASRGCGCGCGCKCCKPDENIACDIVDKATAPVAKKVVVPKKPLNM